MFGKEYSSQEYFSNQSMIKKEKTLQIYHSMPSGKRSGTPKSPRSPRSPRSENVATTFFRWIFERQDTFQENDLVKGIVLKSPKACNI
jgi:hypothetical protein